MSHRTVVLSSFEEYLADKYAWPEGVDSLKEQASQELDRKNRLSRFSYSVMLQVSFPELDFANRWCWQNFGPNDGSCTQCGSEYQACNMNELHSHAGKWASHWFEKTDYDFGYNEWYFAESADHEQFLANVKNLNWGEHYPK